MSKSLCEAQTHAIVRFEELVGEVLSEECKHDIGALRIGSECSSFQQLLNQHHRIR